jgi:hypothetical protein
MHLPTTRIILSCPVSLYSMHYDKMELHPMHVEMSPSKTSFFFPKTIFKIHKRFKKKNQIGELTFMTIIGDFAKGFIIVWCVAFIFLIIEFMIMGQTALAGFMTLGFLVPLSIVMYGYINNRDKKTSSNDSE